MNRNRLTRILVRVLHLFVIAALLTALAFSSPTARVGATPPISGQTIEFDSSAKDVGATGTNNVNAVAVADLDNDGDLDLVTGDSGGNVVVWQNDGTPFDSTWAISNTIGASSDDIYGVAAGDLDNDGDLDIVTVSDGSGEDNEVIAWENNDATPFSGAWTQQDVGTVDDTTAALAVAVGDLDNDGNLDIVTGDNSKDVIAWESDGTAFPITWTRQDIGTDARTIRAVAIGDLDSDGQPDVVSGQTNGTGEEITAWQNDGTPFNDTWATSQGVGNGAGSINSLALGDLDNDGALDVVSGDVGNAVRSFQNDGSPFSGTWSLTTVGTSDDDVNAVGLADLDNDGDLDIASVSGSTEDNEVIAWQNDGTPFIGSWAQKDVGASDDDVNGLAVGDLDNDGDQDLATGSGSAENNEVAAWENDLPHRNAPYADSDNILGCCWSRGVALGDVDGDGDPDAFVANGDNEANKVWLNDGSGVFSDSGNSLGSSESYGVGLGDLDGDGDLDAFVANESKANKVWLNDGAGSFSSDSDAGHNLGGSNSHAVALGDVDGDGDLDAFVANGGGHANKVWLNDGSGAFSDSDNILGWYWSRGVALGDVDGDGDLDAFVANAYNQANRVWTNDGSGTFTDSGQELGKMNDYYFKSYGVALGDVDGDGDLDAFVANVSPQADKVWKNDGSGTFSDSGGVGSSNSHAVALGDVDGDGDLDAFVANYSQANKVWRNQGGSAFLDVTDTSPAQINNATEGDILKVVFTHNGIAADRDLEMNKWDLDLFRSDCSTPLTSAEANAIIDNLRVRLDDGDSTFETDGSDALVTNGDVSALSLTGGVQTITFSNGHANVQVDQDVTATRTYWISVLTTSDASIQSPNSFCINFDPDADTLVEGKTADFSVSQQDTGATNTGSITASGPEMDVEGNSVSIADEDTSPSSVDHTDFSNVAVGSNFDRTFTIQNEGNATLDLTDPTIVPLSGPDDFTVQTQPSGNSIAEGGADLTFVVRCTPSSTGARTATVSIANNDSDEDPYNFDVKCTSTADLVVTKSVAPTTAAPGDTITYTITFTNTGQGLASGVAITDTASIPPYVWKVADLAFGEGGVITITGQLSTTLAGGATFTNTAVITTTAVDSNPGNNSSEAGVTVMAADDGDGVPAAVEDGAPNGGDGNNDGTPDSEQGNVASLPNAVDGRYVTLVSPPGTNLAGVQAVDTPADAPAGVAFPVGLLQFTVQGLAPGGATAVTLLLPAGLTVDTYYKHGPNPPGGAVQWYEFLFDGATGAQFLAGQVALSFVDGQRGDDLAGDDGQVIDEGGPGQPSSVSIPTSTGSGNATLQTNAGHFSAAASVANPCPNSPPLDFPHGFFEFTLEDLTPGQRVFVTITLPDNVANNTEYWKCGPTPSNPGNHWYQVPLGSNDGDNVIIIALTDGGLGDDDLTANGVIVDQGGPGQLPEPIPIGGSTVAVNKLELLALRPFDWAQGRLASGQAPWLGLAALMAAAALAAGLVRRHRR